ncbi:hypothetical protein ANCDUO_04072 [Ancylostoma duodenale]|uniref:Uncharacterized protein n=1 Tax=Ancylostoma duodenale TaxID=51022 RepID=A0A0C2H805_9BILA|nr:hypothetical protein ANCDUO_04072 [Ancylostoma duodenale]
MSAFVLISDHRVLLHPPTTICELRRVPAYFHPAQSRNPNRPRENSPGSAEAFQESYRRG